VRVIGRDLIRLIDEIKKFPEYEVIWKDLLHKPTTFSPTLTNITDILSVRTAPKYFGSRLTPDMEAQLMFILKNVRSLSSPLLP
jgi:integrator complex subunit 3